MEERRNSDIKEIRETRGRKEKEWRKGDNKKIM